MQLKVPAFITSPLTLIVSTAGLAIFGANEVFVKPVNEQAEIAKALEVKELHDKQKNPPMIHGIKEAWKWARSSEGETFLSNVGLSLDPKITEDEFISSQLEIAPIGGLDPIGTGPINYVYVKNTDDGIKWTQLHHGERIDSYVKNNPNDPLVKKYLTLIEEIRSENLRKNPNAFETMEDFSDTLSILKTRYENNFYHDIHRATVQNN